MITISGAVVDATGAPVVGAHVYQTLTTGNIGAVTDADGIYTFEAVENMPVHITYIGFVSEQFTADTSTGQIHELETASHGLDEFEVVGELPKKPMWPYFGTLLFLLFLAIDDE
jgi:hypothetical protein